MSQAFYRKWRPVSWDEVVGQDHIIQTLKNAVAMDRVGHAYLFAGPRGTGKTTSARLLAKSVNCLDTKLENRPCNTCKICEAINQGRFMDLIEIDAASNTSVDDVRELKEGVNFSPTQGKYKVYIIDEVHMLSTSAFNALLKTLEEPPPHVIFILATTEIHKIPATVLSRCQRHEFRRIPVQVITDKLRRLCDDESIQVGDETLNLIARQSTGSLRDAISLVDQLASMSGAISLEMAQDVLGTATSQSVIDLISCLLAKDEPGGLEKIHRALDAGSDPRQFARQVVEYLRNLLMVKMGLTSQVDATPEIMKYMQQHATQFQMQMLLSAIESFNNASTDLKANWHPGLGLELAFASLVTIPAGIPQDIEENIDDQPSVSKNMESQVPVEDNQPRVPAKKAKTPTKKDPQPEREMPAAQEVKISDPVSPVEKNVGGISTKTLNDHWKDVKDYIRKDNPMTEALVNSARLLGIQNDNVILSFPSELLKDRMLKGSNIPTACKALKQVFGRDLKIKCTIGNKNINHLASDLDIDSDGMIGFVTRDLGGEIVQIE